MKMFRTMFPYVFPAPAGINLNLPEAKSGWQRVPRASGDKPLSYTRVRQLLKCSPRQRG
ncbi:Uncharacterised protein [Serratia entomophila]|nr:Uncharacterised protein [Serratia entomophila]CAI1801696.1 Uncharacterised protein [Serratia entomophila]CAI1835199.1 Uncharacterised protein [Serratia entomophila]CAI1859525.1 Uncharacterised protein [Serratia entomophila]